MIITVPDLTLVLYFTLYLYFSQGSLVPGLMYFVCAACGFVSILLMFPLTETKDVVMEDIICKKKPKETINSAVC